MKRPPGQPNAGHSRATSSANDAHRGVDPRLGTSSKNPCPNHIAALSFMTIQLAKGLRARVATAEGERRIITSLSIDEARLVCDRLEDLAALVRKLRDDLTRSVRGAGPGNG